MSDERLPTLRENVLALPRAAWFLFLGTFINRFGSFVMVFLVAWMTKQGFSPSQAGTALAVYGVGHMVASFAGGWLADRFGRRSTIALSMFSSAAAVSALALAEQLETILLMALLTGFTAELYRPASAALLTDVSPPGRRLTAFALYRLAVNLGFAAGPAVAGFLAERSFMLLFIGDAITSVVFGAIALFVLPAGKARREDEKSGSPDAFLPMLLADGRLLVFLFASIIISMVFFQSEATLPLHVLDHGYTNVSYGVLISINGALIVMFELALTSITQRIAASRVIAFGFLLAGIGFGVNAFASTLPLMILGVVIWSLGEIVSSPVSAAYVADLAPAHLRGRYMGALSFTWAIGLILGPWLGSRLYAANPALLWLSCLVLGVAAAGLVRASGRRLTA